MAKYRVNWRTIWRNIPRLIILVTLLKEEWPTVRSQLRSLVSNDPLVGPFVEELNDVITSLIVRRKK